jgi:hypothetical protein
MASETQPFNIISETVSTFVGLLFFLIFPFWSQNK